MKTAKTKTTKRTKKYVRGSLGKVINALLSKSGVDKVTYARALKAAKKVMPKTRFNEAHFAWYQCKFRASRA